MKKLMNVSFLMMLALSVAVVGNAEAAKKKIKRVSKASTEEKSAWSASYFMDFAGSSGGPTLGNMGSTEVDLNTGENRTNQRAIRAFNSWGLNYQINDRAKIFVNPRFFVYPVQGGLLKMLNTRIGIKSAKPLVEDGNFKVSYMNATIELPSTPEAFDDGLIAGPGTYLVLEMQIGTSPFSIITEMGARAKFYTDTKGQDILGYSIMPYLNYSINDTFSAQIKNYNAGSIGYKGGFGALEAYLQFMVTAGIGKHLTLAPYLWVMPQAGVTSKQVALGAEISGAIF